MKKYMKAGIVLATLATGFITTQASAYSVGACVCNSKGCVCVYAL